MLTPDKKRIRFLAHLGARGVLGQVAYDYAMDGNKFWVLSSDLMRASGFERIENEFPEICVNCGIAEANMIGVAAGLADKDMPAIATTWSTFASLRVADQIRNYMGFMQSNVKLIGMDSGYTNGRFGYSHSDAPDIAVISSIPGIMILAPADGIEIYQCIQYALEYKGPVYIRLTGGQTLPLVHKNPDYHYNPGQSEIIKDGSDVAIISNGSILTEAIKASEILDSEGISTSVTNMHTVKPVDTGIGEYLAGFKVIATVEEHSAFGGIGSIISMILREKGINSRLLVFSSPDAYINPGSVEYMDEVTGLKGEQIANKIIKKIKSGGVQYVILYDAYCNKYADSTDCEAA